jgi:hypothetical protein
MVTLAQVSTVYPTLSTSQTSAAIAGGLFILIFYIVAIICAVFVYMSVYNWGTSDSQYFTDGHSSKVLWFWLIFFVPFAGLVYFFAVRPKVNRAKRAAVGSSGSPAQGVWQQTQPQWQPQPQPPMPPQPTVQAPWPQQAPAAPQQPLPPLPPEQPQA